MDSGSSVTLFPAKKRIVVIGDIHGDLGRLTQLLKATKIINEQFQWIAEPKDTWVVQMGDQIDSKMRNASQSGAEWETTTDVQVIFFMRNIDREAKRHGGRVISLLGNHEMLNVFGDMSYVSAKSMSLLGGPTNRAATFEPGAYMARILAERQVIIKIGSFVFCHAGLLPHHLVKMNNDLVQINVLMKNYLLHGYQVFDAEEAGLFRDLFMDGEGILWTRAAVTEIYRNEILPEVLKTVRARALIVGHNVMLSGITTTPTQNLWFVDTGISRSFEEGVVEALEIWDDGVPGPSNDNLAIRVLKLQKMI